MQTRDHKNVSGTRLIILSFSAYGWIIKMTGNEINRRSFPLADKVKYDHLYYVADWLIEVVKIFKKWHIADIAGFIYSENTHHGKMLSNNKNTKSWNI